MGWWSINITKETELTDCDLEHIAELVKEGFTSGEVLEEE